MEFINAPSIKYNKHITQSHPKAYFTSRLLPFTSSKLNETLIESQLSDLIITDITSSKASVQSQLSNFNPISSTNILYSLKSSGIYKKK